MLATDYVGISTLVGSISAAFVSIVVALRQTRTKSDIKEVHDAVRTSNGQTIGELVESNEVRRVDAAGEPKKP